MEINNEFNIGERVFDDLTSKAVTIIGITYSEGYINGNLFSYQAKNVGYWVNDNYLGNGRHPWELSKLKES